MEANTLIQFLFYFFSGFIGFYIGVRFKLVVFEYYYIRSFKELCELFQYCKSGYYWWKFKEVRVR